MNNEIYRGDNPGRTSHADSRLEKNHAAVTKRHALLRTVKALTLLGLGSVTGLSFAQGETPHSAEDTLHATDMSSARGLLATSGAVSQPIPAAASALNIVTPYLPGRTTLNAGVAAYRGQVALGIGVSRWNSKGNVNYNLGISTAGGNSTIVRAGVGIVFGA